MLSRYSPLSGLAERRQRIGAAVEKLKEAEEIQPFETPVGTPEDDDIANEPMQDLTRAINLEKTGMNIEQGAAHVPSTPPADAHSESASAVPAATPEEAPKAEVKRRSSRVKTTLLGFERSDGRTEELFRDIVKEKPAAQCKYPTGWLAIVEGPGCGTAMPLFDGMSKIGRGDDQTIQLDFGDNSISRETHAAIAYDSETRSFYLGHGGKTNIVRLNGTPILSTETIQHGDVIRIGETTLRLVTLCDAKFSWADTKADQADV